MDQRDAAHDPNAERNWTAKKGPVGDWRGLRGVANPPQAIPRSHAKDSLLVPPRVEVRHADGESTYVNDFAVSKHKTKPIDQGMSKLSLKDGNAKKEKKRKEGASSDVGRNESRRQKARMQYWKPLIGRDSNGSVEAVAGRSPARSQSRSPPSVNSPSQLPRNPSQSIIAAEPQPTLSPSARESSTSDDSSSERPTSSTSVPGHSPSARPPPGSSKQVFASISPHSHKTRPQPQQEVPSRPLRDRPKPPPKPRDEPLPPPAHDGIIKQLDTRLIPITQVHKELEAIYGIVCTLEAKCKQVITSQQTAYSAHQEGKGPKPDDHFTLVLAIHRNMIHEMYDLFRASQYAVEHRDASPADGNFAGKVELPARLWKHGIHNLLELFRTRLPESKEYLNAYIILGYQMFTLLLETVQAFKNQWLECLGDLSRYRMAIETSSAHERDLWLRLSDSWYNKASLRQPKLGRLLHHRAILARSKGNIAMLHLYARSLTSIDNFPTARESLNITTFKQNLAQPLELSSTRHTLLASFQDREKYSADVFTRVHAGLFTTDSSGKYNTALEVWLGSECQALISMSTATPKSVPTTSISTRALTHETIALVNIAALHGWGAEDNALRVVFEQAFEANADDAKITESATDEAMAASHRKVAFRAWYLLTHTLAKYLNNKNDELVVPHLHLLLVFFWRLAASPCGKLYFPASLPWELLADNLNSMQKQKQILHEKVRGVDFVHTDAQFSHVLSEDHTMRGLIWARGYLPESHFAQVVQDESEENGLGARSTGPDATGPSDTTAPAAAGIVIRAGDATVRAERCLFLAHRLVSVGMTGRQWLGWREGEGFVVVDV